MCLHGEVRGRLADVVRRPAERLAVELGDRDEDDEAAASAAQA
ncbi:hypothetical protein [Microbacterium sp. ARD31]